VLEIHHQHLQVKVVMAVKIVQVVLAMALVVEVVQVL
jgi:hypothetical protein